MKDQIRLDRGSSATPQRNAVADPPVEPIRPIRDWQFVSDFQRMMGDESEPDTRFFVESWTFGTAVAVENFQQRRQREAERESERQTLRPLDSPSTLSFVQERELYAEFVASAQSPASVDHFGDGFRSQPYENPAAPKRDQDSRQWNSFADERAAGSDRILPMTQQRACQLLGVTAASSRAQIKAAYRQMVSQWHPDRLILRTDEVRLLATDRMAEINEAYHLLRNGVPRESA